MHTYTHTHTGPQRISLRALALMLQTRMYIMALINTHIHTYTHTQDPSVSVCEPWPSCCGGKENCYGIISKGVLGAHLCSPWPFCCGSATKNCFDAADNANAPESVRMHPAVAPLVQLCGGEEKLAQCMEQTQACLDGSKSLSWWRMEGGCTCFTSSVYCTWPQSLETCVPCSRDCEKRLYQIYKNAQQLVRYMCDWCVYVCMCIYVCSRDCVKLYKNAQQLVRCVGDVCVCDVCVCVCMCVYI
jgi:hypothetical protein